MYSLFEILYLIPYLIKSLVLNGPSKQEKIFIFPKYNVRKQFIFYASMFDSASAA